MKVKVKVDGEVFEAEIYGGVHYKWWTNMHLYGAGTASIDIERTYADGEPNGWEAKADPRSTRAAPELRGVVGRGKTRAIALQPFFRFVAVRRSGKAEQAAFRINQLQTIEEIVACYAPREALALLSQARAAIITPWEWSDHFGGKLHDGRGREVAVVDRPADGIVRWKARNWIADNQFRDGNGWLEYGDSLHTALPGLEAALQSCREQVEEWLRKEGVLP